MTKGAAPLTHAKRGRGEPGTDLGHEVLVAASQAANGSVRRWRRVVRRRWPHAHDAYAPR